jgi:hypothetical protein
MERKKILDLMNALAQNPATRRAYQANPQSALDRFGIDGALRSQILAKDWKGMKDNLNDTGAPFVGQLDAGIGRTNRAPYVPIVSGMNPRYS